MRICTYEGADGRPELGVAVDDRVWKLDAAIAAKAGIDLSGVTGSTDPLRSLLRLPGAWDALGDALAGWAPTGDDGPGAAIDQLRLLPPITEPGKIIGIGVNYASHAEEAGMELPELPPIFAKFPNTLRAHDQAIPIPRASFRIDYEAEVAVVVKTTCSDVSEDDAMAYVAGYSAYNDLTARDIQFSTSQWTLGKSVDGLGPIGPVVADLREFDDPADVAFRLEVNGEQRQAGTTAQMIFSIPYLISYLSRFMTLEPGDVIATGTPSGIGSLRSPRAWLREGDVVSVTVDKVGTLTNRMAASV